MQGRQPEEFGILSGTSQNRDSRVGRSYRPAGKMQHALCMEAFKAAVPTRWGWPEATCFRTGNRIVVSYCVDRCAITGARNSRHGFSTRKRVFIVVVVPAVIGAASTKWADVRGVAAARSGSSRSRVVVVVVHELVVVAVAMADTALVAARYRSA